MPFLGVITALPVQAGQRVTSGEILARYRLLPESVAQIRSRLFPTQIKDLEMTQIKLAAKLSELEKQMAGLQQLARQNLTSQQSLDQVEKEISLTCREKTGIAERLDWARQLHQDDLAVLQKQLGIPPGIKNIPTEGKLSAPLEGYVVWVHPDMRVGAEFKPEEPAFVIGKLDSMIIKAQVHELEAMRLKLGDQAEVQVVSLPGKKFTAQVSRVSWSSLTTAADQPSFFEVEFTVPNPEHILKDGLKVQPGRAEGPEFMNPRGPDKASGNQSTPNWFERNPKKTIGFVLIIFLLICVMGTEKLLQKRFPKSGYGYQRVINLREHKPLIF